MDLDDELAADLAGMRAAQNALVERIASLPDDAAGAPSRLPGWTVGHLLTHVARNADSVTRRLDGAARGEVVDQYEGGPQGRADEIAAGAARALPELLHDVISSHERLDEAVARLDGAAWDNLTRGVDGDLKRARELPLGRWREVEVHHVDLGLGYEPPDWPGAFVQRILPSALEGVGSRLPGIELADPRVVVAWTYGRADPPEGLPVLRPF